MNFLNGDVGFKTHVEVAAKISIRRPSVIQARHKAKIEVKAATTQSCACLLWTKERTAIDSMGNREETTVLMTFM